MLDAIFCREYTTQVGAAHGCRYCRMTAANGSGEKTVISPFDGVTVSFNDFVAENVRQEYRHTQRIISIDHCNRGRVSWEHDDGSVCCLGEGDIQVSANNDHTRSFGLPACAYHGISINIFIDIAADNLKKCFPEFSIDLESLWVRFRNKKDYFISGSQSRIHGAFQDLYSMRPSMTNDYIRLKVMEIILALSRIEAAQMTEEKTYFRHSHVQSVHLAKAHICDNLNSKITVRDLAEKFDIPQTTLKLCFKSIYGVSISEFIRASRLHHAAMLLQTSDLSIIDIALMTGYENPSKFSAAFKKAFLQTPLKYRKTNCSAEHF